jgi:S-adenosyl-L-methionine hydrolase (adenosine-forming)
MPEYEWVSFTTDYGLEDGFVAACRGVIARIAPRVRVVDVTHGVPAQDVRAGAAVLAQTVPYLPVAVHLVVVDPGVGTSRRGLVVVAEHGVLVGPDNGVLVPAAEALGGVRGAVELTDRRWWLPEVSRTFHGRDVFAPVAAWLATGVDPAELGPALPVDDLVRPPSAVSFVDDQRVGAEVVMVDRFGNLQLAVRGDELPWRGVERLRVRAGEVDVRARWVATFGDAADQELIALVDSAGWLAVAVNGGSAADGLALGRGDVVELEPSG